MLKLDAHGWPNVWKTLKLRVDEVCGHLFTTVCCNTINFNRPLILNPLIFLMQNFWSFSFSPPWGNRLALLSFELSNQLFNLCDVPSFLSFMRTWAFQSLWDLNEIQALCLFTFVTFVSWFLGITYFSCSSSSWFHDS